MNHVIRINLTTALGLLAGAALAAEPAYPAKPIRIIAQFTPGTSTDILARVIAQKMGDDWGQQVVVDIKSEITKWGKAVKESGAKVD